MVYLGIGKNIPNTKAMGKITRYYYGLVAKKQKGL